MRTLLFIMLLSTLHVNAQIEIFDAEGKRVYHIEDSDKKHEVTLSDGRVGMYVEKILFADSGKSYTYDHKWEQVISDDKVIMTYNFNRRRWEWVEGAGLSVAKYGKKEDIQRIYEKEENVYTSPDQGEYPILKYREGDYIDEFGRIVYSNKGGGGYSIWVSIILVHNYYQENYLKPDFMAKVKERRRNVADSLANTNSIALAMLEIGHNYETRETTFMGDNYQMVYFIQIGGDIKNLNTEQIKQLKNDWLILNPDTRRRTAPFDIPEGGFYVSKKEAKKKGIPGINSKSVVLEIKIKPENAIDFRTAIAK